MTKNQKHKIP